jgi:hypothetical protein
MVTAVALLAGAVSTVVVPGAATIAAGASASVGFLGNSSASPTFGSVTCG